MKATVRTIAKEAGVSPATVSRVFSGAAKVSPQVRLRVLNAAAQAGYDSREKKNVAVIIPENSGLSGYGGMILESLFLELNSHGFRALAITADDIALLDETVVAGAISVIYRHGLEKMWNKKRAVPLVCINSYGYPIEGVYEVSSNDGQGISAAMNLLYGKGHRRIGMMTNIFDMANSRNSAIRIRTFDAFIKSHSDCSGIFRNSMLSTGFLDTVMEFVRFGVTAIIAAGESLAAPVNHILSTCGIRVPEDISLIGFESRHVSEYLHPPVTCLEQRMGRLAELAVELLEKQLRGEHNLKNERVDYNLFIRDSVDAPPLIPVSERLYSGSGC